MKPIRAFLERFSLYRIGYENGYRDCKQEARERLEMFARYKTPFDEIVQEMIYNLPTMKSTDWIKVEDSLPELGEDVLVAGYFDGVGDMETWFSHRSKNKHLLRDNNGFALYDEKAKITHWMKVVLPTN